MSIGERIKAIRVEHGLSQLELGNRCVPPMKDVQIRKYERGEVKPKMENAVRIAYALGVPVSELYGEEWDQADYEARTEHYPPFLQYLSSLGYRVQPARDQEPMGNITVNKPNGGFIVIDPNGEETTFSGGQFKEFEKAIAASVEYQVWQQRHRKT